MTYWLTISRMMIAAMMAVAGVANAADSGAPLRGGVCPVRLYNNEGLIKWNCEHIGIVEIRQIYEKGFRVVGKFIDNPATTSTSQNQYLIIEEQRK